MLDRLAVRNRHRCQWGLAPRCICYLRCGAFCLQKIRTGRCLRLACPLWNWKLCCFRRVCVGSLSIQRLRRRRLPLNLNISRAAFRNHAAQFGHNPQHFNTNYKKQNSRHQKKQYNENINSILDAFYPFIIYHIFHTPLAFIHLTISLSDYTIIVKQYCRIPLQEKLAVQYISLIKATLSRAVSPWNDEAPPESEPEWEKESSLKILSI